MPAAAVAIVAAGLLAVSPFLAGASLLAVLGGGVTALGTQMTTHFLLGRWRARDDRFMAAILAGFAIRVAVVVAAAVAFALADGAGAIPFMLSLGAFLISLLAAESVIEHGRPRAGAVPAGP